MKVVKKIATDDKPDGIAYAPPFHKAYVSDERAKAEAVIDTRDDRVITTLHFDRVAQKVYVNLQDQNVLAVIDPATDTVVGRIGVARFFRAKVTTSSPSSTSIPTRRSPICLWRRGRTLSSSILDWDGSM
jgi:DNA-binding beta-propeller fold protein YncE